MGQLEVIEKSIIKKYRKQLWRPLCRAVNEYDLIQEGDRIAVCISGGKDSMLLAKCMQELQRHWVRNFALKFLVMDPGYAPENRKKIEENAALLGVPIHIFESNIFEDVAQVEKNTCYLCAKMRRGYLYRFAQELGCNKIALGHHFDDVIETILMAMLYGAQVQTMMPKLHSTNFPGMDLIRPLYFVREEDIKAWCRYNGLSFIQCACRVTERSQTEQGASKRQEIKQLLAELRKVSPYIDKNIFNSVVNVNLNTLISYHKGGKERYHFLDDYDETMPQAPGEEEEL